MTRIRWALILAIALCGFGNARADGDPKTVVADLRTAVAELAGDLAKLLNGQGEESLAIGQFTGPANFPTSSGPGVVQLLTEELGKKNVQVKTRAKLGVKGQYKLTETPAEHPDDARLGVKVLAIAIEVTVEDSFGNPVGNFAFKRTIRGEATVFAMTGISAALPPSGTEPERDKELRKQYLDPKPELPMPAVKEKIVRSKAGSPFGIEVLVGGKGRDVEGKDGLAFVGLKRDDIYAIRLINDSDLEVAVQLKIDGLSLFAFSGLRHADGPKKGEPLYTALIVAPKKDGKPGEAIVPGWHRTDEKSDSFQITEYAKSAAATLNHTAGVGTITATFQASWSEGAKVPSDEPGKKRSLGSGDATGFGPQVEKKYEAVKRTFGVIRDSVSVRYTKPQ